MVLRFMYILILLQTPQLVFSSEKSKKDTFAIDDVYVTRVRPAERDISAVSLQTVTRKEFDLHNGNTVADVIKSFSGINIKDYGGIGGFKTVMVRSLGANHTGVYLDGIQFTDAAAGQIDLGKICVDNAEAISLYIGQMPNSLQPARMYASASVLNVQPIDVFKNQKPLFLNAKLKTGSFGLVNPSIIVQNKWSQHIASDINLSYSRADGVYPYKLDAEKSNSTWERRKNSEIESYFMNADFKINLKDSSRLSWKLYFYNSQRGLPGAVVYYNPYSSQQLWNKDFFTNIRFETNPSKKVQWLTNAKFSQNYLRYLDPTYHNQSGVLDNSFTQFEYYFSQAFGYSLTQNMKISVSSDLIINQMKADIAEFANPVRYSSLTVFSSQLNFQRLEIDGNVLASIIREETEKNRAAHPKNVLTPSLGFSLLVLKKHSLRLRFLYKDIFRMPTFNDLYYNQVGNVDLNPESTKQISLGASMYTKIGFLDYFSIKSEIYQNHIKDKIVAIPTKNLFVWSMRNIGKVDIKGFETNINVQTKSFSNLYFNASFNYSFQQAQDVSDNTSSTYKQQIPYIPYENISGLFAVTYKSYSLSWNGLFNGYRYVLGENVPDNMLPSWWLHNIAIVYNKKLKAVSIKIKAELDNAFNNQYEVIRSFPMPGRTFMLSIGINY